MRGTVAIHAGQQIEKGVVIPADMRDDLIFGSIIRVVDVVAVVTEHKSKWFSGPYGFVLKNPRELVQPIPCKGQLGFWNVPAELEELINKRLESG